MGNHHYDEDAKETPTERAYKFGYEQGQFDTRTREQKSLRDEFAISAIAPLVHADATQTVSYSSWGDLAKTAYQIADAMLEARKDTKAPK